MNSHKETEKFYLPRFKELCPEFPDGDIEDSEPPDFLVRSSDGIVGIELTRLFNPNPIGRKKRKGVFLRAVEAERDKIVDRIKEYYISQGGDPLRVSIHFSGDVIDKNSIKDKDLECVATMIKRKRPQVGSTTFLDDDLERNENFPDWLAHISIFGLNQGEENFWTAPGSACIPTLAAEEIQKRITEKEEKYPSYREKCSSAWLVLMTRVEKGLGTHVKFSTEVWNHRYETFFEQVWIFQNPNSARKLEIVKPDSTDNVL